MASIIETAVRLGLCMPHAEGQEDEAAAARRSEGLGALCVALSTMDKISEVERDTRSMDLESQGRRLQGKYGDQVGLNMILKRTAAIGNLCEHLSKLHAVGGMELARRVEVPFQQEHICIERTLHGRMVEVVEGAYAEVCSANDELELADWCRRAHVPLPQLDAIQKTYGAELERCEAAKSSILLSINAMKRLHSKVVP